jgi:acetyltransferase-like isoleucine patch superfamily enzyme
LIAAGSLVTKDVPKNSVTIGNPAKVCDSVYKLKCKTKINQKGIPYEKLKS